MTNIVGTLTGLFKEVYAPSLEFLLPKGLRFQNDISFVAAQQMPGNNYNQPVVVKHEHGFTYESAGGTDAFGVNAAVAGQIKNAQVVGAQMLLQSILNYESAARASSGGKRAYVQATKYLVENMWQSTRKRLEIDLLYGQSGLAIVASVATNDITITTGEFAAGIWAGMEGASIIALDTTGATLRAGTMLVEEVNLDTRVISVDTAATGLAPTDVLYFYGQAAATPTYSTMIGIHAILTNTGAQFGIDASEYSLWKSSTLAVGGGNLSFENVQKLIAKVVGKGADTDLTLYVNPETWATLLSDQAALRRHGDPNKSTRYTLGSENIEFFSQVGRVTIKASIYVKEGYAYLFNPSKFHRIGATDITFRLPDRGDEFFFHIPDKAGYALRSYSNQAVFSECPGVAGYLSGIVNT